jgi:Nif-specific regulatory protein
VLQEGSPAVGDARNVNVRIVAASNRNLEKWLGALPRDLYYRLKVFPLRVPPLRERRDDIPILANAFLKRYASEFGRSAHGFTQQALEL